MTTRPTRGNRPVGATKRPTKRTTRPRPDGAAAAVTAVDGTAALQPEAVAEDAVDTAGAAHPVAPADVPPIDARVLLRALMTPPEGLDGAALTDALTGAVPTWRLDEEPIYLEVVRDLGVPALDGSDTGAGEVIVGEVVVGEVVVAEVVPEGADR